MVPSEQSREIQTSKSSELIQKYVGSFFTSGTGKPSSLTRRTRRVQNNASHDPFPPLLCAWQCARLDYATPLCCGGDGHGLVLSGQPYIFSALDIWEQSL